MNELALVGMWMASKLENDPVINRDVVGGVHNNLAPSNTPCPYIIFKYVTGSDKHAASERAMSEAVYRVVLVTKGKDFTEYLDVLDAIDTLLDNVNERVEYANKYINVTPKAEEVIQEMSSQSETGERIEFQGRNYRVLIRAGAN